MSNKLVEQYTRKNYLVYLMIVILTLIACKLPNKLVESVSPLVGAPTESVKLLPTAIKPIEVQTTPATPSPGSYPEQQSITSPASSSLAPSQTNTPAYNEYPIAETSPATLATPIPENVPNPQQVVGAYPGGDELSVYPGLTQITENPPYPGIGVSQTPTMMTETYPGAESSQNSPSPTIGTQSVPYPQPTLQFTISAPTFLPTVSSIITLIATPTQNYLPPTPTSTASRTPFMTPTPTLTFTPTPTRTPLPAPPWLNVRIQASDPTLVDLASGKPQFIQFFAYWSGSSLAMAPIVAGLEKEYGSRVGFVYIDIDNPESKVLQSLLGFEREPHFFLINGPGKVLYEWVGYATIEEMRRRIETIIP